MTQPIIELAGELQIANVGELRQRLNDVIEMDEPVVFRSKDVSRVDAAALQLFTAFVIERQRHGRKVQWNEPAPALVEASRLLGLTAVLGIQPSQGDE